MSPISSRSWRRWLGPALGLLVAAAAVVVLVLSAEGVLDHVQQPQKRTIVPKPLKHKVVYQSASGSDLTCRVNLKSKPCLTVTKACQIAHVNYVVYRIGSSPLRQLAKTACVPIPTGLANLWINTTAGASPSRCSGGGCAYDPTHAYGSWNAAYQAASSGDTILINGGTYSNPELVLRKIALGTSGPDVTFGPAPGQTATYTQSISFGTGSGSGNGPPNHITIDGGLAHGIKLTSGAHLVGLYNSTTANGACNFTLRNLDLQVGQPDAGGGVIRWSSPCGLLIERNNIGPICCGVVIGGSTAAGSPEDIDLNIRNNGDPVSTGVVVQDNNIQGEMRNSGLWNTAVYGPAPQITCPDNNICHNDGIHDWGDDGSIIIRRNQIYNTEIQAIFFEEVNGGSTGNGGTITDNIVGPASNNSCGICVNNGGGFTGTWNVKFNTVLTSGIRFVGTVTDEKWTVDDTGATAGTFTITVEGQTTTPLAFNASSAAVQTAVRALSTVGSSVTVAAATGPAPFVLDFTGQVNSLPQGSALAVSVVSSTTGATTTATRTTAGSTRASKFHAGAHFNLVGNIGLGMTTNFNGSNGGCTGGTASVWLYRFNFWQTGQPGCDATDGSGNVSGTMIANPAPSPSTSDGHLSGVPGSTLVDNFVPPSVTGGCTSFDVDLEPRPANGNCDAGADERGVLLSGASQAVCTGTCTNPGYTPDATTVGCSHGSSVTYDATHHVVSLGDVNNGTTAECRQIGIFIPTNLVYGPSNQPAAYFIGANPARTTCGTGGNDEIASAFNEYGAGPVAVSDRFIIVVLAKPCNPSRSSWLHPAIDIPSSGSASDGPYLQAAITYVETNFNVDPQRIYISGSSSAGGLANGIACETAYSTLFRGYAPEANAMPITGNTTSGPTNNTELCPSPNTSFFYYNGQGSADTQVNPAGVCLTTHCVASFDENRRFWAAHMGCGATATHTSFGTAGQNDRYAYTGCLFGTPSTTVDAEKILNGGHGTAAVTQNIYSGGTCTNCGDYYFSRDSWAYFKGSSW